MKIELSLILVVNAEMPPYTSGMTFDPWRSVRRMLCYLEGKLEELGYLQWILT